MTAVQKYGYKISKKNKKPDRVRMIEILHQNWDAIQSQREKPTSEIDSQSKADAISEVLKIQDQVVDTELTHPEFKEEKEREDKKNLNALIKTIKEAVDK